MKLIFSSKNVLLYISFTLIFISSNLFTYGYSNTLSSKTVKESIAMEAQISKKNSKSKNKVKKLNSKSYTKKKSKSKESENLGNIFENFEEDRISSEKIFTNLNTKLMNNSELNPDNQEQKTQNNTLPIKKIDKLSDLFYKKINDSGMIRNSMEFKNYIKNFASNKLFDREIEEIYTIFNKKGAFLKKLDFKLALELFIKNFEKCDKSHDNKLNLTEFEYCMKNDNYLKNIKATPLKFAGFSNYSFTDENGFNSFLFNNLDSNEEGYMTFYDYMILRLMVFAWKKCSVNGPYIDELSFECGLDIVSDWRGIDKNTARNLYNLGIKLAPNGHKMRNMDFITFFIISTSIRLYGKINLKEDNEISQNEFFNSLDSDILPYRYNQEIIKNIFKLMNGVEQTTNGIDIETFIFIDFYLRIFYQGGQNTKKWQADLTNFQSIISTNYLPHLFYKYFQTIPQNFINSQSLNANIYPNYGKIEQLENNYFLNFIEKKNGERKIKSELINIELRNISLKYDKDKIIKKIFHILDSDEDDFIDFYDFGLFVQSFYIYSDLDENNKGRLYTGELYEGIKQSNGIPSLSDNFKLKSNRLSLFDQDTYVDVLSFLILIKMPDFVERYKKKSSPDLISEIDFRSILEKFELHHISPKRFVECLRGKNRDNIQNYDWECAFTSAIKHSLLFYEKSVDYITAKSYNMTLSNVAFEFPEGFVQ